MSEAEDGEGSYGAHLQSCGLLSILLCLQMWTSC
jgi:hypothetical protein